MEAVQQNTSLEVQMSHSSGPRIQEALIYNIQYFNVRDDQMILSRPLFLDAISISTVSCTSVSVCQWSFMVDSPVRDIFEFYIGFRHYEHHIKP